MKQAETDLPRYFHQIAGYFQKRIRKCALDEEDYDFIENFGSISRDLIGISIGRRLRSQKLSRLF